MIKKNTLITMLRENGEILSCIVLFLVAQFHFFSVVVAFLKIQKIERMLKT